MGAVDQFTRRGIRLELADGDNVRAIGTLNDSLRSAIKTQKAQIIGELQRREFEALLSIVAPAYNTPAHEYAEIREAAAGDMAEAIICFRSMAKQIKGM
ncbi:MAG: hypothetical protein H7232_09100 [Aeromicrobium sp.]|nr:hypothetical protein [Burkholderiales bacterium]